MEIVDGDDEYGEEQRAVDTWSVKIVHGRDEEYQVEGRYVGTVVLVSNMMAACDRHDRHEEEDWKPCP